MTLSKKHLILAIFAVLVAALLFWSKKANKNQGSVANLGIEDLKKEVDRTCSEAQKYLDIFQKKFPTSNSETLKSDEWKTAMSWGQACDSAKADLEEALQQSHPK